MPAYLKGIITALVALVAGVFFFVAEGPDGGHVPWVALGLAVFMILAIWLFPEARKTKGPPG